MISSVVVSSRECRSEHGSGAPDPDGGGGAPRGGRVGGAHGTRGDNAAGAVGTETAQTARGDGADGALRRPAAPAAGRRGARPTARATARAAAGGAGTARPVRTAHGRRSRLETTAGARPDQRARITEAARLLPLFQAGELRLEQHGKIVHLSSCTLHVAREAPDCHTAAPGWQSGTL